MAVARHEKTHDLRLLTESPYPCEILEKTSRKIAAKNIRTVNRMDVMLCFITLNTGVRLLDLPIAEIAVFVTTVALISNIVAITVAPVLVFVFSVVQAVAVDAGVVAAEVNAAVAVVGEESFSSADSVRELEDALASPQDENATLPIRNNMHIT